MRSLSLHRGIAVLVVGALLTGCSSLPNGRGWGQDATPLPGWKRIGEAAADAALDRGTWALAGAALVFGLSDLDQRVSDWAIDHTPIYGSQQTAGDAAPFVRDLANRIHVASVLATPSGDDLPVWALSKGKGYAVGLLAVGLNGAVTQRLKVGVGRTRPRNGDTRSFPSKHASDVATKLTLASRNVETLPIPESAKTGLRVGFAGLALAGGWARVEAGGHFPSDVLAGWAIGRFLAAFMNDAFMGLGDDPSRAVDHGSRRRFHTSFAPSIAGDAFELRVSVAF
jgi:membrane-associated phospholipid phosphatase